MKGQPVSTGSLTAQFELAGGPRLGKERNLWRDAWAKLIANRLALGGLFVFAFVVFIAIFGPFLAPYDHYDQDLGRLMEGSTRDHIFGTDELGRDMLSRIMAGGRTAVLVAIISTTILGVLGVLFGAVAAYMGGLVDAAVIRTVDILQGFPHILLAVLLAAWTKPLFAQWGETLYAQYGWTFLRNTVYLDYFVVFGVLGITGWPFMARLVRGQVLSLRESDYIMAARVIGVRERRIIRRHLIPNALGPVVVSLSAGFGGAMLSETTLSFLGLGVQPPAASWGRMISENLVSWRYHPHLVLMPGLVLSITVLAITFVGDGLNDALNPRILTPTKK